MKLIICVDDNNGMAFNCRRQSSDRAVLTKIAEIIQGENLWLHPYSEKLFATTDMKYSADTDFLDQAASNDYCFAEVTDVKSHFSKANEIIIFRWNRKYAADLHFPMDLLTEGWKMTSLQTFSGNSHAEITQEIYLKC